MAKNNPAKKARDPMMARSDIPLVQRQQLALAARIRAERQDAAETIMKLACIELNEMYGLGYERLTKFAVKLMETVRWYYSEDPDVANAQVNGRLEQMGFSIGPLGDMRAYLGEGGKPVDKAYRQCQWERDAAIEQLRDRR